MLAQLTDVMDLVKSGQDLTATGLLLLVIAGLVFFLNKLQSDKSKANEDRIDKLEARVRVYDSFFARFASCANEEEYRKAFKELAEALEKL